MSSHTTKRCSWHEFPSACAVALEEGRHPSGWRFLFPLLNLRKILMGKNCSVRQFCSERLPGPWAGSPPSNPSVLGLHSTHVGEWAMVEMLYHFSPHKNPKQWRMWVTSSLPLFLWGSAPLGRVGKVWGGSLRNDICTSQPCTGGQELGRSWAGGLSFSTIR